MNVRHVLFLLLSSFEAHARTPGACRVVEALYAEAVASGDAASAHRAEEAVQACNERGEARRKSELKTEGSTGSISGHRDDGDPCTGIRDQLASLIALRGAARAYASFSHLYAVCEPSRRAAPGIDLRPWTFDSAVVTSPFGWRQDPFTGLPRFHHGVDLDAEPGDAIPAAAAGVVTFVGYRSGSGNVVVLHHPSSGLETRYAHNARCLVRKGQVVEAGQPLAEAGSTGRSTGVHLHFEVSRDGVPLDPAPYLADPRRLVLGP